jgi:lysophospholipase L1-like esterase
MRLAFLAVIFCCSCSDETKPPLPVESRDYLAPLRSELVKEWPDHRTINIVCHGHSVPAGFYETSDVHTFDAYPHLLHVGLNKRFPSAVINVIVTAHGGEISPQGAARFEADVLAKRPDVITIDYGVNDRVIRLEDARAAWESMIESALAQGAFVVLMTPTSKLKDTEGLEDHAEQIRELAAKYDVGLCDSLKQFQAYVSAGGKLDSLMATKAHPNRKGHEIVANQLLALFPE